MCGISAIISKKGTLPASYLADMTSIIRHRGPDDEGFLLYKPEEKPVVFAGNDTAYNSKSTHSLEQLDESRTDWQVGLGHRRLSILDLSPAGHQPMIYDNRLSIVYNGEVYNYIEIRHELEQLGNQFISDSDTEVIIRAWHQWGAAALHKFNGMFSFVLLDSEQKKVYAVRDRYGIKPLYYTNTGGYIAFGSEVKQLRTLPEYKFDLNKQISYEYLRYGYIDHAQETFYQDIEQIMPGHMAEIDLRNFDLKISTWYELKPKKWKGTDEEAIAEFRRLLSDSVKLRMRSDVPVGSALSGGLDSSTIVSIVGDIVNNREGVEKQKIKTVTSCSTIKKYDEQEYANEVIKQTGAEPERTFPTFEKLKNDMDRLIWHMDYPFGSTSQFSQWCVFEKAKEAGLIVMLDGQGADEQLAGYSGNDLPLYSGLLRKGKFSEFAREVKAYKSTHGYAPKGFILGAVQNTLPNALVNALPEKYNALKNTPQSWIATKGYREDNSQPKNLQEGLLRQFKGSPLPSLLRYEDRNSMAFSVESRVPFLDYRLVEFTLGLPERVVYRDGVTKYILRTAFQNIVPAKVLERRDKMGFVSPEEYWFKNDGKEWFTELIERATDNLTGFVVPDKTMAYFHDMQAGKTGFNFDIWRIVCMSEWLRKMQS